MKKNKYKLLLVNPPSVCLIPRIFDGISFYEYLMTSEADHEHFPGEHLGIQYIASYLDSKRNDTETWLLNACVERHTSVQQTYEAIESFGKVDVIGFTGPIGVFKEILWLAEQVKKNTPETIIVYGQYFASLNYEQILEKYPVFDFICVGDGEVPFERFFAFLNSEITLAEVPSFSYLSEGKCVLNRIPYDHTVIKTLLPRRDYADKVLAAGLNLSIVASRGCPYRCSFCVSGSMMAKGELFSHYFLREPISVVDELELLVKDYGIKKVVFVDDTFAAGTLRAKEQAKQIALEIIRRNLHLSIMIDTRIDCIEEHLFSLLKKAGVSKVFVGMESINTSALNLFNKGFKAEEIKKRLAILRRLGITTILGIINFNPQSTLQEIRANVDFLLGLDKDLSLKLSHAFIPYPGTVLTNRLIQSGNLSGDFPFYTIKYDHPQVALLQKYYEQFSNLYIKALDASKSPEDRIRLESLAERFFYTMLDIADKDKAPEEYHKCFAAAIEKIS